MLVARAMVVNTGVGSALLKAVKYVNRVLPDREKHFSFRQHNQGGLSENRTFEVETGTEGINSRRKDQRIQVRVGWSLLCRRVRRKVTVAEHLGRQGRQPAVRSAWETGARGEGRRGPGQEVWVYSKCSGKTSGGFKQGCYDLVYVSFCSNLCFKKILLASPSRMNLNVKMEARHRFYQISRNDTLD